MDNRILPKAIIRKFRPINIEDAEDSVIEIKEGRLEINNKKKKVKWHDLREMDSGMWVLFATGIFIIVFSCWKIGSSFYKYNAITEYIMYIVDNDLEPTEENIKSGYDETWAKNYKWLKGEGGKEKAKSVLMGDAKNHYFIEGSPIIHVLTLSAIILLIIGIYFYILSMSQAIILDRGKGTFTVSRFWRRKFVTADFADDKELVFRLVSSFRFGQNRSLSVCFIQTKYECEVGFWNYEETLSFFTHYMDRNRPLPEGTAFDPYRQEDYERRKAEGFPKPLFPSSIPMTDVDGNTQRYKKG